MGICTWGSEKIIGKYKIWRGRAEVFHGRWGDESVNVQMSFLVRERWLLSPTRWERRKKNSVLLCLPRFLVDGKSMVKGENPPPKKLASFALVVCGDFIEEVSI